MYRNERECKWCVRVEDLSAIASKLLDGAGGRRFRRRCSDFLSLLHNWVGTITKKRDYSPRFDTAGPVLEAPGPDAKQLLEELLRKVSCRCRASSISGE
jgi:hypothetical protein